MWLSSTERLLECIQQINMTRKEKTIETGEQAQCDRSHKSFKPSNKKLSTLRYHVKRPPHESIPWTTIRRVGQITRHPNQTPVKRQELLPLELNNHGRTTRLELSTKFPRKNPQATTQSPIPRWAFQQTHGERPKKHKQTRKSEYKETKPASGEGGRLRSDEVPIDATIETPSASVPAHVPFVFVIKIACFVSLPQMLSLGVFHHLEINTKLNKMFTSHQLINWCNILIYISYKGKIV